jgi:hypothetical protein
LTGTWTVTSIETNEARSATRNGVFTVADDGTGTVATSTGFRGTLTWSQDGSKICIHFDHGLRRGWTVAGRLDGVVDTNSFQSSGRLLVFDEAGAPVETFSATATGQRQQHRATGSNALGGACA